MYNYYAGFKSHGFTIKQNKLHVHFSKEVLSGAYPSFDDKKHSERISSLKHYDFVTDNVIIDGNSFAVLFTCTNECGGKFYLPKTSQVEFQGSLRI